MMSAPSSSSMASADTLVQLIVTIGGSGVLVAVVQGIFTRRKTRAEVETTGATATKLITDAAASVVSGLQADNMQLRSEILTLRTQLRSLEAWREAAEHHFERHEVWDTSVAAQLRNYNVPVGDPPPLRPDLPRHNDDAT